MFVDNALFTPGDGVDRPVCRKCAAGILGTGYSVIPAFTNSLCETISFVKLGFRLWGFGIAIRGTCGGGKTENDAIEVAMVNSEGEFVVITQAILGKYAEGEMLVSRSKEKARKGSATPLSTEASSPRCSR